MDEEAGEDDELQGGKSGGMGRQRMTSSYLLETNGK